uniref:AT-rich interactive domain-containing protein 2 n=1 Tax=Rhipicephalus pulchellus TaxID=72859 RepID=L7M0T7_RHIPC
MEKLHKEPGDYTKDSSSFTLELQKFHESRGSPFRHAPRINGREVDLFALYNSVTAIGGWQKVNDLLKWDYVLDKLNFPKACANASLALRQVYVRYLSLFEKVHFLGEDADEEADPGTESRGGRKSTGAALVQVPMSYNKAQHDIPESQRLVLGLSPCPGPSPEYSKLCMSLLSGLPNEETLTLNVCTLLSNEGRHSLKLDRLPRLVDLLLSQAGLFPADDPTLRPMLLESWQGVEGRRMERFWEDNLDAETISLYNIGRGSKDEEDELFNLNYEVGTRSIEGQRVLRIALIFHNLSFEERNAVILAKNRTFIRFVMLSALSRWSTLRQVALDTIGNLAAKLVLYPALDEDEDEASSGHHCYEDLAGERQRWSCSLLRLTREGIQSQDRYLVVRCLDILARLCRQERNAEPLLAALDTPLCRRVFELLTVHDLMLLIYALEALYMLSELGRDACERMLLVHRSMGILVSLLTLDPLVYGPLAQKGMKLIETIDPLLPPPQAPAAATNNPAATPTSLPMSAPLTPSMVSTGGSAVGMNAPATAAAGMTGTTGPGPGVGPPAAGTPATVATGLATTAAPQSDPMDTEAFAGTWVRAMYEPAPPGCMVARNDIYAEYVTFCSKAGRKSVISASVFSNCVKAVYTQTGLRRVDGANGVVSFHHDGLRKRLNPLPVPIQVTSCLSISTQAAATTLRTPLASGGTASSHSPILKAQLSAPLRALTPPGNQVSPPPSPATTAPPVVGTPPAPPPPGGAPPGGSSNLIKSLLANKVSRNLQRHQQMQQQQQQSTVVTSADAEVTPVTAGTPVLANSAALTRTPEPVRREVNPASAVGSHQPQHHQHQPAVTAQSFSFVSTTSSAASIVTAGAPTAQTTQQATTCLTSALQAKLQQQPQALAHNSVQPQTQGQSLGTALHLRVQPHVQVQVPTVHTQPQIQVQVPTSAAHTQSTQVHVQVPTSVVQAQQAQVQAQVPTSAAQAPHAQVQVQVPTSVAQMLQTQVQAPSAAIQVQQVQMQVPNSAVHGQQIQLQVPTSAAQAQQAQIQMQVPASTVQVQVPTTTFQAQVATGANQVTPSSAPVQVQLPAAAVQAAQQRQIQVQVPMVQTQQHIQVQVPTSAIQQQQVQVQVPSSTFQQQQIQVQVPNSSVQVSATPGVQAQFQQQVQVHTAPVVQTQVQQVQVQVPTQICHTPLHAQVQTAAGPVLIQSTQPATVVQGQPAQVVVSMAPSSQVPASISVPSVSVQTSMPVQTPLQVTFSTPVSTPLLASAIASAQSSVPSSVSAVGLTQTLPTSLATNVTSNLASGQTVVMAPNLASNLGGGSAVVVGSALPSNPVMAQGTSLAASLASGGGLPPGATIVMVPNSATGITTGMLVVRPQGKMPAGAVNAALLARSQAVANAINAGARGPLIVSTRPNGFQRDIVMEVSMPPEYKQELPPPTQQVSATGADHPIHNHVGENGAAVNAATGTTTTTVHKCIAILPSTTTTTSGTAAETKLVESVVYKSSPLLNGLLDKGKVPLAMDSSTLQNGSVEDETAQHADGSTPMVISDDVNVAVTNGAGTPAKTTASSDLSSIQDIVGSVESASKVISRSGVDVAGSPALKRAAEPDGGGGCAKRLRLEDSSESTFQVGDATERQGSPPAATAPASQQQSVVVMARTEGGGAQHVVVQQSVIQQNVTQHGTTLQPGGGVVQLGCTHQALVQPKTQPQTLPAPSATPQVVRVVTTTAAAPVPQPNLVKLLSTMDSSKTVVATVATVNSASTSAASTVAAGSTTLVSTQSAEVKPVATASKTVVVDGEKKATAATSSAAAHHHHHHHHHHKAAKLVYHCEWKGCDRTFSTPSAVFYHACKVHIPEADNDVQCQWDSCDDMKRRRLSLFTHLQDRHCNEQVLQIQAVRRQQISQFGKASLPPPAQPPPHPGYAPDAALLAIRRHALAYYNHRDASDEKESALAKSIRLTSALIIRNLATYSSRARRYLRRYEQQLSTVAMSPLESSRTIAQCLLEMSRVPTPD